jgi:hypothetical protein
LPRPPRRLGAMVSIDVDAAACSTSPVDFRIGRSGRN